jgi:flagellar export protein FliJ
MSGTQDTTRSLSTLVDLRGREVDRLAATMAEKQAVRDRYQKNLDRLERLCAGSSGDTRPGALSPMLSMNHAGYKQTVLAMVDTHRQDLALHEADMVVTQRALNTASLKREVLGQVLDEQSARIRQARDRQEQKRTDDMATQAWARGLTR